MAWYLVNHRDDFTLYFYFAITNTDPTHIVKMWLVMDAIAVWVHFQLGCVTRWPKYGASN